MYSKSISNAQHILWQTLPKAIGASVLAVGLASFSTTAAANYQLTLCGASPGGLWSLLGAGIDAAVKEAHPGSTITYQTSGGGYANIAQLDQGKCDLAIIHDAETKAALAGTDPFKSVIDSMQTVSVLYTWAPMQIIMNKSFVEEHNIKTLEDVAANKVPVRLLLNKKGNVASGVAAAILEASGASIDDIKSWGGDVTYAASKEQGEIMRDRRADGLINSLFVNHRSLRQLASALDVAILPVSAAASEKVAGDWSLGAFTIPGDAYDFSAGDVETVTLSAHLFAHKDADATMVADITRALVDHVDKIAGVHKAMAPLDPALMASSIAVPYHAEAASVYKQKGLQ